MKKITLTYIGMRLNSGRLLACFLDEKGEECFFARVKFASIGCRYQGYHTKDSTKIKLPLKEIGCEDDYEKTDNWRAEEIVARTEQRKSQLRVRADKCKDLLRDVETIKRFTRDLKFDQVSEFVHWLISEIQRERREKLNAEFHASLKRKFKKRRIA